MPVETKSFLKARARTESNNAARATDFPAAWSYSRLAQLYLDRCVETMSTPEECVGCEMEAICLSEHPLVERRSSNAVA